MDVELRVRIDAGVEQALRHLEGRRIVRRPIALGRRVARAEQEAVAEGAHVDGDVQRRAAPPVGKSADSRPGRAGSCAMSNCMLSMAIISGVTPSGVGRSMSAPRLEQRTARSRGSRSAWRRAAASGRRWGGTARAARRSSGCPSRWPRHARSTSAPRLISRSASSGLRRADRPHQRRLAAPLLARIDVGARLRPAASRLRASRVARPASAASGRRRSRGRDRRRPSSSWRTSSTFASLAASASGVAPKLSAARRLRAALQQLADELASTL